MRLRSSSFALLLAVFASLACASSRSDNPAPLDRRTITKAQIREHHFLNAFEVVNTLRPNWLYAKAPDSFKNPSIVLVYYDNTRLGGINELRSITTDGIEYIRYYDGTEASTRWGLDHGSGVIFVSSRSNNVQ